jgi:hypothetical protein
VSENSNTFITNLILPYPVARTPSKLAGLLGQKGVSEEVQKTQLRVISGNAQDESAVRQNLVNADGSVVSTIVYGLGGAPALAASPPFFKIDDPNICQHGLNTLSKALNSIKTTQASTYMPPYIVAISTTGIDSQEDDVPWLLHPLYHW